MLDKVAVKEVADIEIVAEEAGIPMRKSGKNTAILCPCHDDQHFGSCFLNTTNNTFHCYACGARGDVFYLVQKALDLSFPKAVEFVADTCGGKEHFTVDKHSIAEQQMSNQLLPKDVQNFLGIYDEPVYKTIDFISVSDADATTSWIDCSDRRMRTVPTHDKNGYLLGYCLQMQITNHPLYDLYKNSPSQYRQLVDDHCKAKLESIQRIIDLVRSPDLVNANSFFQIREPYSAPEGRFEEYKKVVSDCCALCGKPDLIKELSNMMKYVQKLSVKYGNGGVITKSMPVDADRISAIANSIWAQDKDAPF